MTARYTMINERCEMRIEKLVGAYCLLALSLPALSLLSGSKGFVVFSVSEP
jgi:hypothetical protein